MKKDKPTNQSNSQQQDNKLKKQYSNQPKEEFRQQESTIGKVDKTLNTGGQQQLNQTTAVLDRPVNVDRNSSSDDSKLKKQYSNQPKEEFRQQESTVGKIEKTLDTSGQQQLNQTSNVLNGSANNQNSSSNGSKLKKQYSNQPKEEFRQQESTTGKSEKTLNTSGQQQLKQTTNVLNRTANNQNLSSEKSKLKKVTQAAFKSGANGTKKAVTKYQKELEKDDQGVKVASKGVTGTVRSIKVTAKVYRKLRQKKVTSVKRKNAVLAKPRKLKLKRKVLNNKNFKKVRINLLSKEKLKVSSSKNVAKPRKLKLKRKVLNNKNFKKARINPLSKEKPKVSSLKKITKIPAVALKKGTLKYQKELEKGDDGVKLVSQGATSVAKVRKKLLTGKSKVSARSGRLNKQSTKLLKSNLNKNKKLQVQSKTALKKRAIKKKLYYAPQRNRVNAFKGAMSSFSNRISKMFKNIGKFKPSDIKRFIGAKLAAAAGGGLLTVLPLIIVAILCLIIAGLVAGVGSQKVADEMQIGSDSISPEVRKWCPLITKEAQAQGMEAYVDLLASIIQVESGGKGTRDIMQSSESAGYPVNYWSTEELSVRQGVKHLKNIVNILQGFGSGFENNTKLLAQAYNFGSPFAGYVGRQGGAYTLEVAEAYSRDVVAPSLGNHTGATVPYINDTSVRLGKPYRYVNGGNFLYGELVGQYGGCNGGGGGAANITGDFAIVLKEIEKYKGWPYSWGGKSPKTGFDCSGLTSWGLKQIGINLPSYAQTQYNMTVPISPSEAQPGDLIFFKGTYGGPNHISHVGFYIDENTMYDSNGSGIGYHNWKDKYWQAHFAGIRRVVTK